jgi:arylsulfatase A-like enzyme
MWWLLAMLACGGGTSEREAAGAPVEADEARSGRKGTRDRADKAASEDKGGKRGDHHDDDDDWDGDIADKPQLREREAKARDKLVLQLPRRKGRVKGDDVLLVTWDTIRADHMSGYGYIRRTTPKMDRLMTQAVVFERFIVPMATTLPSHTSMFTGVRPEEHGIVANVTVTGERFVPSERLVPLAKHLTRQGYVTIGAVSSAPLKRFSAISSGFTNWSEPVGDHRRAEDTVDAALKLLEQAPDDRPVFLWLHLYDPHAPYDPPPGGPKLDLADRAWAKHFDAWGYEEKRKRYTEAVHNRYDRDILYTDQETARFVKAWQAQRDWDRTVFALAGDHGEGLTQHGHMEHGLTWDEQLHTPFFVIAPDTEARRVPYPVGAHDLVPTLMGLADLPDEAAWLGQVTGRDVLAEDFEPTPIFSRMSLRQVRKDLNATFALTGRRWKFVGHAGGKRELFDLDADPHELDDVADEHPEVCDRLAKQVKEMLQAQRALAERLGSGETEELDDGTISELRELGYME